MDNEQERNEHFKGFADLLAEEIEQVGHRTVPGYDNLPISYGHWKEAIRLLLAQRAYDLAAHVLAHQLATDHYIRWPALSAQEVLQDGSIPDLTEWPKTPLEASAPDE